MEKQIKNRTVVVMVIILFILSSILVSMEKHAKQFAFLLTLDTVKSKKFKKK